MKIAIFSTNFVKNLQIPNFMKFRTEGAKLLHEDGRTDMTKLIVAFRNFAWKWLGFFFLDPQNREIPNGLKLTKYHVTNKCTNCILCISLKVFNLKNKYLI